MMSEEDVPDVALTASIVDPDFETVVGPSSITVEISDESKLLGMSRDSEPLAKRIKLDDNALNAASDAVSIKQILFNINQAICLRLDAIETKLEAVSNTTKMLEDKIEHLCANQPAAQNLLDTSNTSANNNSIQTSPAKDLNTSTRSVLSSGKKPGVGGGAVVVGMPQTVKTTNDDSGSEKYVVNLAGSNLNNTEQNVQNFGPNVTLITLNSEDDFPHGTWLGDENNPEMRVRVPISPSDLLHIHSNCRTAERMALTLLDYLFDRETQAYSNLSGMGKHGKKQLDPLMIYGVRCHLIHHFNVTEHDWHRIKQNINSKCRTAFRRKVRGLPLNVKAFRGKSPATYIHVPSTGLSSHRINVSGLGDTSDEELHDDSELQIQTEVDVSNASLLGSTPATAEIIQSTGGHIQVLHATPEQVAQLQQTHQIQILQGDQLMQFQDNQESVHVAVPMSQSVENIQVINTENGDPVQIPASAITHEIVNSRTTLKVEDPVD